MRDTPSACCGAWFLITCLFAALFGWTHARNAQLKTECVHIRLVPDDASVVHGMFVNGTECVYRDALPAKCKPYYEDVPSCSTPPRRPMNSSSGNLFSIQTFDSVYFIDADTFQTVKIISK